MFLGETEGVSKGAYLLTPFDDCIFGRPRMLKWHWVFILICDTVNQLMARLLRWPGILNAECPEVWTCQTHNLRTDNVRQTCFALALHHNWSFSKKGCWFVLSAFLLVPWCLFDFFMIFQMLPLSLFYTCFFLLLALHPELQRVSVFNFLHLKTFAGGCSYTGVCTLNMKFPRDFEKRWDISKQREQKRDSKPWQSYTSWGCATFHLDLFLSPIHPVPQLWPKPGFVASKRRSCWARARFRSSPSYMGRRWNKELPSKLNGMLMQGCF